MNMNAKVLSNFVGFFGLVLPVAAFFFLLQASNGDKIAPLLGLSFMGVHLLVDFVHGSELSPVGRELKKVGQEVVRFLVLVLLGIYAQNDIILVVNVFSGCLVFGFTIQAWRAASDDNTSLGIIKRVCLHPLSLNSLRALLVILPPLLVLCAFLNISLVKVSTLVSIVYFIATVFCLMFSLRLAKEGYEEK